MLCLQSHSAHRNHNDLVSIRFIIKGIAIVMPMEPGKPPSLQVPQSLQLTQPEDRFNKKHSQ